MKILSIIFIASSIAITETRFQHEGVILDAVHFSIRNAGIKVNGCISGVQAEINFEASNLNGSSIQATADPSTIQTGIAVRDKHLKRSDYFDIKNYPVITIRSKSFQQQGKSSFSGQFDLTIKNITRTITIPFTLTRKGNFFVYKGSFEINRLDFKLGEESLILNNTVSISLEARQEISPP